MRCRSLLTAVSLGLCIGIGSASEAQAWPRPVGKSKPREAAPASRDAELRADDRFHINTLLDYTTQELQLPLDNEWRAFEAVVTVDGEAKILDLEPYNMRSPDFRVLVQNDAGELVPTEVEPPKTYRGTVRGEAGSLVSASLIDGRIWANVDLPNRGVWAVQPLEELVPGVPAPRSSHAVYHTGNVLQADRLAGCGVKATDVGDLELLEGQGGVAGTGHETLEIGCDADFEYFQINNSNVQTTVNDIEILLNGVEFIYERDVDIAIEVTTIIVRTTAGSPYTSSNAGTLLNQFGNTWNSLPESGIRRDVAHLFTGKNLGNTIGIAVTPSTCFQSSAYSLVESKYTGSFTLRQSLSAHELGHTLSALHCDGNGDCHIMCSGNGGCDGVFGANLRFGFQAVNQINAYQASGNGNCLAALADPIEPPFFDDFEGTTIITPAEWSYNDGAINSSLGVSEPSGTRSMNLDSTSTQLYSDDEVRTNFILLSGESNFVASYFTQHLGVEAGKTLTVYYWASNFRWTELDTITSDGVDQTQFTFHQHVLPPNAHWNEFRLRFQVDGSSTTDDWYIDDVYVGPDPGLVFGACCLPDFTCNDSLTQDQCVTVAGGTWQGDDTECTGVDCSPVTGACCFENGSCQPGTTQNGCEVIAGGTWMGADTECTGGICDPPTGACCAANGDCIAGLEEDLCTSIGGLYQGDNVDCESVNCPKPTGACCAPDGECIANVSEAACTTSFGGVYQGDDVECGSVNCPQPTGACCMSDGGCVADVSDDECTTLGGVYQGDESDCESVDCPVDTPCPADIVDGKTFQPPPDGFIDGADLAYLLGEWGDNPGSLADIVDSKTFQPPPDGIVDGADLAFLLGEWGDCD